MHNPVVYKACLNVRFCLNLRVYSDSNNKMAENCRISPKTGFLFENPLDKLPSEFEAWETVTKHLPQLIKQGTVRSTVDSLPSLNASNLKSYDEIRLAQGHLSSIASAYVWSHGEDNVPERLPENIAVPLVYVSDRIGLQPVHNYAGTVLSNCKSRKGDIVDNWENTDIIVAKYIDAEDNTWFWVTHARVEVAFARCLPAVLALNVPSEEKCPIKMTNCCKLITTAIGDMVIALNSMHEHLDPVVFYRDIRPFLSGFSGKAFAKTGGLIMQGVSERPFNLKGGSAAQSPTLQTLDRVLGIGHLPEAQDTLDEALIYMPFEQRNLIQEIKKNVKLRDWVLASQDKNLREAYNEAVVALINFRSEHIKLVARFMVAVKSKVTQTQYEFLKDVGSGGTDFMPFLKANRDHTQKYLIN